MCRASLREMPPASRGRSSIEDDTLFSSFPCLDVRSTAFRSNLSQAQTEESMSTCRFAQRVSTIKNNARINEDVDPVVLIRRLKSDCAALADEVAFLKVRDREASCWCGLLKKGLLST